MSAKLSVVESLANSERLGYKLNSNSAKATRAGRVRSLTT